MRKQSRFFISLLLSLAMTISVMPLHVKAQETKDNINIEETQMETGSIKEAFSNCGLKVGTCLSPTMIYTPEYSELIKSEFSSVTLENAMKPDYILDKKASIEAGYPVVEFSKEALDMMEWAKENGLSMRGHTLIWYSQTPKWIFHEEFDTSKPLVSSEVMLDRMDHYISQVFSILDEKGYSDIFYAYDIVNEGVNDNGGLRDCLWKETIGDDYIWHAFYFANKYAPETIDLYYNDYNEQYKYGDLMSLVKTLVDEDGNYLIDGIGLQGHLYTKDNLSAYFRAMEALSSTGLKLQITELDVSLGDWKNPIKADEETLEDQRKFYENLIDGILERVDNGKINMDALTFWGFADNLSWRNDRSPLLFDSKLNAKPAYYGVVEAAKKYEIIDTSETLDEQSDSDTSENTEVLEEADGLDKSEELEALGSMDNADTADDSESGLFGHIKKLLEKIRKFWK